MDEALIQAVVIASGGILSPGSMLIALLLLSTERGLQKAFAYYVGYFGMYVVIGTGAVLVAARMQVGEPTGIASWIYIGLGCLLLFLAVRKWRTPDDGEPKRPAIFDKIDGMSKLKLSGLGAFVACVNFKNLSIFLSAIAAVVEARLSPQEAVGSALAVAFIFCLAVLGPILLFVAGGKYAKPFLDGLRARLERNSRVVTLGLLTIFGSVMLGRGLFGLAS